MNKVLEFIKKLFRKNLPLLNEGNNKINEESLNQKTTFFNKIKVYNNQNEILVLQRRIEDGTIEETDLNNEQINKLKELYCKQITNLSDSINKYRLKLDMN